MVPCATRARARRPSKRSVMSTVYSFMVRMSGEVALRRMEGGAPTLFVWARWCFVLQFLCGAQRHRDTVREVTRAPLRRLSRLHLHKASGRTGL
jgi:hypothetical protein